MKMQSRFSTFLLLLAFLAVAGTLPAQLFTKVTSGPVVNTPSGSRSCNWLDFDNDGFQDLLITNGKAGGEDNMLYHNEGNGSFTLMNDIVCQDGSPSDGATCGDYDNDGFIDIYVANWYNVDNLLYRNNAGSAFAQVTTGIVATDGGYSESAAWGDMDDDGLLDLYVANSDGDFRNFLYRNLGGGTFEKVNTGLPVTDAFRSRCVNWIDYDLDGDQDLFVANENGQRNQLYRNDGYPTFTKISTGSIATSQMTSHSSSWADYDNDGDFDVLVANYNQADQLFRNDGSGNFSLVNNPFGGDVGCAFSSAFADYDNDADLDLLVTNGYCSAYTHNFLYENDGSGNFSRNLSEPIAIDSGSSYGCAWGDYDNDGFQDLVIANWRNETQRNSLYHNSGNGNHWFELKLEGNLSNRSAIGTIVRLQALINGDTVTQMREVSAQSGYCSQNSLVVHFGLADATSILSLQVNWPSGNEQVFVNLNADHIYSLLEGGSIGMVGIQEPLPDGIRMRIFPNPSDGTISLEMESPRAQTITAIVQDQLGRPVYATQLQAAIGKNALPIDLRLASGVYFLQVSAPGEAVLSHKFIVGENR